MLNLENYYAEFRRNTIGYHKEFRTCFGIQRMVYADWTASGRLYRPIENRLACCFGPFVGNTHSEASITGSTMTKAYNLARQKIKEHVNAGEDDILIVTGYGMTSAVNRLQRTLGLRFPRGCRPLRLFNSRPIVILTHMEHHSNYVSWLECDVDVVTIPPDENGLVDLNNLEIILKKYNNRPIKIGSFTACSNVTGIITPYHQMAKLMHLYNGICLLDACACAPYTNINMHPEDPLEKIDGLFYSPHKFLGGPGSSGILIFDSALYSPQAPDNPGGGTVLWTNPWGNFRYLDSIESREDGGTPGFLQTIKAAMSIELKSKMKVDYMLKREHQLTALLLRELSRVKKVHVLQDNISDRLGIVSLNVEGIHHNLVVKILNDCFGIQTRGGCSCAGPYGHYLLNIDEAKSKSITDEIDRGNLYVKPGWVRISLHPMMTSGEICYIVHAIREIIHCKMFFEKRYIYDSKTGEFRHKSSKGSDRQIRRWFKVR